MQREGKKSSSEKTAFDQLTYCLSGVRGPFPITHGNQGKNQCASGLGTNRRVSEWRTLRVYTGRSHDGFDTPNGFVLKKRDPPKPSFI